MQTEQRALELETELALAHDALQDWRTVATEIASNDHVSSDDDSWRWVHAAEEQARSRQEAVLRSLINFMHVKKEQMQQHQRGRRGSSDAARSNGAPSPSVRRLSIAPEDMMGRSRGHKEFSPRKEFMDFKEKDKMPEEETGSGEDDTMTEEEEMRNEAKLRQVEQLVRRMSLHLEETVNVSAPRVKPTQQDVKTSSRMVPFRR